MYVLENYFKKKFNNIGMVVDCLLNPETSLVEGLKIFSNKIPIRAYYANIKNLKKSFINYESIIAVSNYPRDISPGVFESEFLKSQLVSISGIEVFDKKLLFLGELFDLELSFTDKKILKIWTTSGHEIIVKNYYLDNFKGKNFLVVESHQIISTHKKNNNIFNTRAFTNLH